MSQERTLIVQCPHCGQKNEFTVIDVLDSVQNPFEKEALFNNRLFDFKCGGCNETMSLLYDFIYYDSDRDFEIYFCDRDKVDGVFTALALLSRMEDHLGEIDSPLRRVEYDYDHLCEKICILENDYDDKIMELVKVFCLHDLEKNDPTMNVDDAYFCIHEGVPAFEIHAGDKVAIGEIPDGMYEEIFDEFIDKIIEDEHLVVNLDWAINVINHFEDEDDEVYNIEVTPDRTYWEDGENIPDEKNDEE